MKKGSFIPIFFAVFLLFQSCGNKDLNVDGAKISIGTSTIKYFTPKVVSAYNPLEGFVIKLSNDTTIFTMLLPNKNIGEYSFAKQYLEPGKAIFHAQFNRTLYGAQEGNINITDTSNSTVTGTYSITRAMDNYLTVISITNGKFDKVPVEYIGYGTIADLEGNQYKTIHLGTQTWMAQNLKSNKYANGDSVKEVYTYSHNDSLAAIYGRLYTWAAATHGSSIEMTQGVCPVGWHLPSLAEWQQLINFLGGDTVAATKMKSLSTWTAPNLIYNAGNTGEDNTSGFNALGAGMHDPVKDVPDGFDRLAYQTFFWSSSFDTTYADYNTSTSWVLLLTGGDPNTLLWAFDTGNGFSVRCVKDTK